MNGRKLHTIFSWLDEQVENKWENLLPKTESWKDLLEIGRKQLRRTLMLEHKYVGKKRFTRLDDSTRSSMNESGMLPFKSSLSAIIVLGGLVLFSAL